MTVSITIRNVPSEVRNTLAARAAASGRSLQEYLLRELAAQASRPTADEVIARAQSRARFSASTVGTDDVVDAVRADRDDSRR